MGIFSRKAKVITTADVKLCVGTKFENQCELNSHFHRHNESVRARLDALEEANDKLIKLGELEAKLDMLAETLGLEYKNDVSVNVDIGYKKIVKGKKK